MAPVIPPTRVTGAPTDGDDWQRRGVPAGRRGGLGRATAGPSEARAREGAPGSRDNAASSHHHGRLGAGTGVLKVPLAGGPAQTLATVTPGWGGPTGLTTDDTSLYFVAVDPPSDGGTGCQDSLGCATVRRVTPKWCSRVESNVGSDRSELQLDGAPRGASAPLAPCARFGVVSRGRPRPPGRAPRPVRRRAPR
jgi:hypothetical protein